jgi:hypothetical protein
MCTLTTRQRLTNQQLGRHEFLTLQKHPRVAETGQLASEIRNRIESIRIGESTPNSCIACRERDVL